MVHLTAIYWGPTPSAGLAAPGPATLTTTRTSASGSQNAKLKTAEPPGETSQSPGRQSRKTVSLRKGRSENEMENPKIETKTNERRMSVQVEDTTVTTLPATEETQDTTDSGYMAPDVCICIIGIDTNGAMPLLFARGGRINRVYQCSDHFVEKSVEVERIYSEGQDIAVMLSNGDIRFFEFYADDQVMALQDLQFE